MSVNQSLICARDRKVRVDAVNVRRFTLHTKYPLSLTYTTDAIESVLQDSLAILVRFARIIRQFIELCTEYSSLRESSFGYRSHSVWAQALQTLQLRKPRQENSSLARTL